MAKKRGKVGDIWRWTMSWSDGEHRSDTMLLVKKHFAYEAQTKERKRWLTWLILDTGEHLVLAENECFDECWDEEYGSDGQTNTETWEKVG